MPHVTRKDMAPGLRLEGLLMQKLNLFRSQKALTNLGKLTWGMLKLIPGKLINAKTVRIPNPNGGKIPATLFKGEGFEKNEGPRYAILWLHGGGYAAGGPNMVPLSLAHKLLNELNCIVLAPDYSLTWRKPHPAQLEESWASLLWLKEHADDYGITADKLIVGGESAGAGLAVGLCLYARDHGFEDIGLQIPLYPMLDCLPTETNQDNDAPIWNTVANESAWRMYLGEEPSESADKYASPARETDWTNLPPAVTFVGTIEPFYAEVKKFVADLKATGTPVRFREFPGAFHAFDGLAPFAKISKEASAWAVDAVKDLLKEI